MNAMSQSFFEATGHDQVPAQESAGHSEIVESSRGLIFLDENSASNLIQTNGKISKKSKPVNKAIGRISNNKISETKKKKSKEIQTKINENVIQQHVINNGENIDESFDAFIQSALDNINGVNVPDKLFFQ